MAVYWNAFWALHNSRQVSMAAMPIQVSEILAYCRLCGFREPTICHDLMRMIQALDDEWLALDAERMKAEQRRAQGQGKSRPTRH